MISVEVAHYNFGAIVMHGVYKVSDAIVFFSCYKRSMRRTVDHSSKIGGCEGDVTSKNRYSGRPGLPILICRKKIGDERQRGNYAHKEQLHYQ